jgi:S-DNA-T family DNA segregation ATPase FtsK/SpoIIIE
VRGGWVPDEQIKQLEAFVTGPSFDTTPGTVLALPAPAPYPAGGVA